MTLIIMYYGDDLCTVNLWQYELMILIIIVGTQMKYTLLQGKLVKL